MSKVVDFPRQVTEEEATHCGRIRSKNVDDVIPLQNGRRGDADVLNQVARLLDQIESVPIKEDLQQGWERAVKRLISERFLAH